MSDARDERRKLERAEERRREEEMEKMQQEPRLPSFEAPAKGIIVENPSREKPAPKPKG